MLYEQTSLRRDEFRLKSANHILVKMSKIMDWAQIQPSWTSYVLRVLAWLHLFHQDWGSGSMRVVTPRKLTKAALSLYKVSLLQKYPFK